MSHPLRKIKYQDDALVALGAYLRRAREISNTAVAFVECTLAKDIPDKKTRPYIPLSPRLSDAPHVCLRLPTGGGKTLLATRALKVAAQGLEWAAPLFLWLVPSITIRQQTLNALKTPGNFNCETLREQFPDGFEVLDVAHFDQLKPHEVGRKPIVIVSTLATSRVEEAEDRHVYAHSENLMGFFKGETPGDGLEEWQVQDKPDHPVRWSLMNLLHLIRPIVVVDEAQNNASALSVEVMERINPRCVVEFTATPAHNSNILHYVFASELQDAHMIKLPIFLTEHPNWQQAIHAAVQERQRLAELAEQEKDYIRPILLIQAESRDNQVTWETILDHLQKQENLPREKIAIATGEKRELDDVLLMTKECPVEVVITVKALKEGWDCSFAYVFCSVATVHSKVEVEQILGRVLRMPYAAQREQSELNHAYAHVSSACWQFAVKELRDCLVAMGFDEIAAEDAIREQHLQPDPQLPLTPSDPTAGLPLFSVTLRESPDLSTLTDAERDAVHIQRQPEGYFSLSVQPTVGKETIEKIVRQCSRHEGQNLRETYEIKLRERRREHAPVKQGKRMLVPQLFREIQGELHLVGRDTFIWPDGWRFQNEDAALASMEFDRETIAKRYQINIEGRQVVNRFLGEQLALKLDTMRQPWSEDYLLDWLQQQLVDSEATDEKDISALELHDYLRRVVLYLQHERKFTLAELQQYAYPLKQVVADKIARCRATAYARGFQQFLNLPGMELKMSFDTAFEFKPDAYHPYRFHHGPRPFERHFFPDVAEMNNEEYECAVALDEHPQVDYWIRNLDSSEEALRWPVRHGWFYPDFVAQLKDARQLVLEYKGELLQSNPDEQAKRDFGLKWAACSDNKALFLWATKRVKRVSDLAKDIRKQLDEVIGQQGG